MVESIANKAWICADCVTQSLLDVSISEVSIAYNVSKGLSGT